MRRSLALIAVGAAVAVAAVVVVAGMTAGDGGDTPGAAAATSGPAADTLPSGHPSVAMTEDPEPEGDVKDTIARLEQQRAADPTDVAVLLDLGEAYFLGQRLREARQAYSEAEQQDPGNAAAQVGLAMVAHAGGDSARAEEMLRAVLDAHPDDQAAHYSLAILFFSAGHVGDAKAEWETAARIDPKSTTGRRSQSFVDLLNDQKSAAPETNE